MRVLTRSRCPVALRDILPDHHPNITKLILNVKANPMPLDHPPVNPWIGNLTRPSYTPYRCVSSLRARVVFRALSVRCGGGGRATIPFWHPLITTAYKTNNAAPSYHPDVQRNFSSASLERPADG
jgi:hypothetical protein